MTVQCIDCSNFAFGRKDDADRDMAKHGFGYCEELPAPKYSGARYPRECPLFEPADAEIVGKRVAWLEGKTANDLGNRRAAFGASVLTDGLAGNG